MCIMPSGHSFALERANELSAIDSIVWIRECPSSDYPHALFRWVTILAQARTGHNNRHPDHGDHVTDFSKSTHLQTFPVVRSYKRTPVPDSGDWQWGLFAELISRGVCTQRRSECRCLCPCVCFPFCDMSSKKEQVYPAHDLDSSLITPQLKCF